LGYDVLYITTKDMDEARRIGLTLVQEKLAACVNYFSIRSLYRWHGQIEDNPEVALLVKTRQSLVDKVIERTKALHSYEVPCIESWKIGGGYPPYLKWIEESTEQERL
jgi:periplasmic divalent cation tolerance protein